MDEGVYESHAIKRARERLGKNFDKNDISEIVGLIIGEKSVLLGSCPNRGTQVHLVQYEESTFKAVFDPSTNILVTFFNKNQKLGRGAYNKRASGKRKRRGKHRKNR